MNKITLTSAEENFLSRMAVHMKGGLDFDEAARRVLDDDKRIFKAVSAESSLPNHERVITNGVSDTVWCAVNNQGKQDNILVKEMNNQDHQQRLEDNLELSLLGDKHGTIIRIN
ncbi:hypothetical protein QTV49_000527 [Vibrio vulnificus]|nr:hypothetical protein [Vibrio vulnificus]